MNEITKRLLGEGPDEEIVQLVVTRKSLAGIMRQMPPGLQLGRIPSTNDEMPTYLLTPTDEAFAQLGDAE